MLDRTMRPVDRVQHPTHLQSHSMF